MNAASQPDLLPIAMGEGLGNRFLIFRTSEPQRLQALRDTASLLCGERFDGLLVLGATEGAGKSPTPARILNRDGSDGGTCLNGLRVLAVWSGMSGGRFLMDGREVPWRLLPGNETRIELHLQGAEIPADAFAPQRMVIQNCSAQAVAFWNPHCVIEVPELEGLDLQELAASARRQHELFPAGVNTEAVVFEPLGRCRMRVFERGVGETEACGSGAVAVALAAWARGWRGPVCVEMPGGILSMERASDGGVLLTGGASAQSLGLPGSAPDGNI